MSADILSGVKQEDKEDDIRIPVDGDDKLPSVNAPEGQPHTLDNASDTKNVTNNPNDGTSHPSNFQIMNVQEFADFAASSSEHHFAQICESSQLKLQELVSHQNILLESLEHENEKFSTSNCFSQMDTMMAKCREYNSKLVRLKKTMVTISQRTAKIKKQCSKLQELKAKSLVEEEEARRKEMEREKWLVAQPVTVDQTAESGTPVSQDG